MLPLERHLKSRLSRLRLQMPARELLAQELLARELLAQARNYPLRALFMGLIMALLRDWASAGAPRAEASGAARRQA